MFTLFRRRFGPLGPPLALVLILCIGGPAMRLFGAEPERRSFALAAGDAEKTLEAFSIQADVQIVFLVGDVHGVTTNPIKGSFATREALDRFGATLADVLRMVIYVPDREDIDEVSETLGRHFRGIDPVSTLVCSPLSMPDARVEVEVTARCGSAG